MTVTKPFPSPTKYDEKSTHKAVTWQGARKVEVQDVKRPQITDSTDAILRITSTAICGSDLHFYEGYFPGMKKGDIVGHEFMGIVEDVGSAVKTVKKGDRVVSSFGIACGDCRFCNTQDFSICENINPSKDMEMTYGDRIHGMYGYSHLSGGFAGGQAEYVRSINADTNLLKVPAELNKLPDAKLLFLSDIYPTAWHACELGNVSKGDVVAVWGAGPVGILAVKLALVRGAKHVYLIDNIEFRLQFAAKHLKPGVTTLNFDKVDVVKTLKEKTEESHGVDVGIDAVGMHYAKTLTHKVEMAIGLESDSGDTLTEIITSVRKGGRVSIVGAYAATTNHFPIGAFMEKQLHMAGGQTPCQKYWPKLVELLKDGTIDPSFIITHTLPLERAAEGYKKFSEKSDDCLKVVLFPES